MTAKQRRPRVRLWVVALALFGGGGISRSIFAARGVPYIDDTQLGMCAWGLGLALWFYWLVIQAPPRWVVPGSLLAVAFVLAAGAAVLSSARP
jgi:hypothetical protein